MKGIKYIISFLVLFIGMLIIGESHTFRLNDFQTEFANTTMYIQPNTSDKEMISDILNSAQKNKVEVFAFIKSPRSTFYTQYDVYGTSGVENYINENLNIFEREYPSLFLGKSRFTFKKLNDIATMDRINDFYVIGDKKQVKAFKMELIDKYAGNHPKEGYKNTDLKVNILFIWFLIMSVILLLTFYDVILQKKENLIRVSMGENIHNLYWKNVTIDSLVYIFYFLIIIFILSKYTYVFFGIRISVLLFLLLLLLNALLYLNLYFYDVKEVFSNSKSSRKLLSLNYSLKLVTSIITIFIISSNLALIFESYKLYKQKPFFEEHKEYYYTRLEYKPYQNSDGSVPDTLTESAKVQATFYREFIEKFDAFPLVNISNFNDIKGILANRNSYKYLSKEIDELNGLKLDKDIYFILPEKLKGNTKLVKQLNAAVKFYEGSNIKYEYEILFYKKNIEIISIDENYTYGSDLVKNPVIVLNNLSIDTLLSQQVDDSQKINYVHDVMYKISNEEFNQFVEKYHLTNQIVSKTNVLDNYKNKWNVAKRVLYINFVFSALILFLEFIIISSIIKLEYEVNAIELALKKVLGHTLFEKHRKLISMTIATSIVSIIASVIIAKTVDINDVYYLIIGGITIIFLEVALMSFYIHKTERMKLQKILKGGNT
ncbi:hypothetical protein ACQKD6_24220 [Bacillus cereus]|uniref:hypothetical protein n=1 Tax=Bacillus cereus TaxID=1396 RepID=UPI003D02F512